MNKCLKCDNEIDDHRYHLGYTECVECSDTEKYSAHQVYPHKTGGYVQPVSSTKKKHLDRWLKKYYENKDKPKPKRKVVWKTPKVVYISMSESESMVRKYYDEWGYQPTLDYCKELYLGNKISMVMKNQLTNMITDRQMLPKRLRKWVQKIR